MKTKAIYIILAIIVIVMLSSNLGTQSSYDESNERNCNDKIDERQDDGDDICTECFEITQDFADCAEEWIIYNNIGDWMFYADSSSCDDLYWKQQEIITNCIAEDNQDCVDSDGLDYENKGEATGVFYEDSVYQTMEDSCANFMYLYERTCNSYGYLSFNYVNCQIAFGDDYQCVDGACIQVFDDGDEGECWLPQGSVECNFFEVCPLDEGYLTRLECEDAIDDGTDNGNDEEEDGNGDDDEEVESLCDYFWEDEKNDCEIATWVYIVGGVFILMMVIMLAGGKKK